MDDPASVRRLLDEIRSCNCSAGFRNISDVGSTVLVPTRLRFDDSFILTDNKKRKFMDSDVSVSRTEVCVEDSDVSMLASLRETRCIKAELAATKAQETNLEEQIKKLHRVRLDLDLMCDNEKTSLKEQDRETIKLLEAEIAYLRKQGMEDRDELFEYRQTAETVRYTLEKTIIQLQEEYNELDSKMKQVQLTHMKCAARERRISELEAQLALATEEATSLKDHIKSLEGKVLEVSNLKHQVELTEHRHAEGQQRIKLLELEQEKGKEVQELLEEKQLNLLQFAELEREAALLQNENRNLRDAVHNKLVLEEEVIDLRSRQAAFEEREQRLAQLEASHRYLESMLEDWRQLARDHCLGILPEKAVAGPELLRMRIETLKKKALLLTADKRRLDSRLKTVEQEKRKTDTSLDEARRQIVRLQAINEERTNAMKRLQKRLLLVSYERDSCQSQLNTYEKDITGTSPRALNSQQQQQRSRIDALETTVEGYRELVERLEGDLEKTMEGSGGIEYNERIRKFEEERNALLQEKEQLMKRRNELEVELERRALTGGYSRMDTKVLPFRTNPAAQAEMQHENKLKCLEQDCDRLRDRVQVLEEEQT